MAAELTPRRWPWALALILALGPGCADTLDDVQRITAEELRRLLEAKDAVAVDVRSTDAFAQLHITGALSIPLTQVANRAEEIPQEKMVATYCT